MDVFPVVAQPNAGMLAAHHVVALVDALRTPRFRGSLFSTMRDVFRCAHLSAFAQTDHCDPMLLLGADSGSGVVAQQIGLRSLSLWDREPTNRVIGQMQIVNDQKYCIRLSTNEMVRSEYRRRCYDGLSWFDVGSRLVDRVSLVGRRQSRLLKLNLYRHKDDGRFNEADLSKLADWSDFLFTLLEKHVATDEQKQTPSAGIYVAALRRAIPNLPMREAEVCAEIALGMTSEAIALKLGISANTVLTYRKRAYARLNISSQNELTRLVYDCMNT